MKEKDEIIECIAAWAIAKDAAKDNANLLLKNWAANEKECIRRMKEIDCREEDLFRLSSRVNLPAPLVRYINARDDRACSRCWSSSSGPHHQECRDKIDEFFMAESLLIRYGLSFTQRLI